MLYIVKNEDSNFYINDLLDSISLCLNALGIKNETRVNEFPKSLTATYLLVPHEWETNKNNFKLPKRCILARSIALITENPGSTWSSYCRKYNGLFAKYLFINKSAKDSFPAPGKTKLFFQLFNPSDQKMPTFDEWRSRKYKYLFVGGSDDHRKRKLAELSQELASDESFLFIPETKLSPKPGNDQLSSHDFDNLLQQSKVIVNLHRENTNSVEWQRLLKATQAGCVFFSEVSAPNECHLLPWVAKEFKNLETFASQTNSDLELFNFAAEAQRVNFSLKEINSRNKLKWYFLSAKRFSMLLLPFTFRHPLKSSSNLKKILGKKVFDKLNSLKWNFSEYTQIFHVFDNILSSQKSIMLANITLRRLLQDSILAKNESTSELTVIADGLRAEVPHLTIAIPIFQEGTILEQCLESVCNLDLKIPFDVVLCSDAGNDQTIDVAHNFLLTRNLSWQILKRNHNGGVGATRNTLMKNSRSNYILMLDGDNTLFPKGATRLYDALRSDEGAYFSYGLLAVHRGEKFVDTMNNFSWDKNLFPIIGNYIDALALINRERILEIGGYSESISLYGWEDFDLWARIANAGGRGAYVRNYVAKYRKRAGSMISLTNISSKQALDEIIENAPNVWKNK